MIHQTDSEKDYDLTVRRRDLLRTVGIASTFAAVGVGTTSAQPPDDVIVGTTFGNADVALGKANSVTRTLNFGPDIGEAVVGRWPETALEGLKRNPHVRYVESDTVGERLQQTLPWGVDRVDAEVAHDNTDTGGGIDVGIIDSGIDSDHTDLEGNLGDGVALAAACTGCDEDWDDVDGHGTNVAGVVGAIDNTEDVIGVAPNVTLHALKDGDAKPQGSATAAALEKAADEGYAVVNISSSLDETQTLNDAIDYAVQNDVVVVASAGNNPCPGSDCVSFPANDPDVIAVSATNDTDGFANFSSEGSGVDVTAPGVAVPTTSLGGGTASVNGTSFSAPHVTAAAALLRDDGVSPGNVETEIENSAEDIGLNQDRQGSGLLDVATALDHDSANDLLEVETDPASSLDFTEATLNGDLIQVTTGLESATVGFEWGEQGTGLGNTATVGTRSAPGTFGVALTGLEEDTTYEFRAFAEVEDSVDDVSTEYGRTRSFSTVDNLDPIAAIGHSPPEPNPGQTVTFDGSGSDPGESDDSIVSYEWDLDDDGRYDDATGVTSSQSYSVGGSKTVGLKVTDEYGQTDTATHTFYVNKAPTASFTVSPDPVVRNESATFDASGSNDEDGNVVTYEWDWDYDGTFTVDESTSSATTSHTFTTGGEHTVALRVTDDDGTTSDLATATFTVHIRVEIDVKPNAVGSNPINPNAGGNVPVAVLHTSAFDPPAELDPDSVHFGDPDDVGFDASDVPQGGATPAHAGGHVEDVDGDGDVDSVFHFPTGDADFDGNDSEGELVGLTQGDVPVFATDSVTIRGSSGETP